MKTLLFWEARQEGRVRKLSRRGRGGKGHREGWSFL
jgi:hypothetical protein